MRAGILFCAILVIALAVLHQANSEEACDSGYHSDTLCSNKCYEQFGQHGECDYGVCKCQGCIYRGCRRYCRPKGKVAQCQENTCECLS